MNIFRKTDGYTEVTAITDRSFCELYVTSPGDSEAVLRAHFSAKIAWRLGLWLLKYWITDRWFGLRTKLEQRAQANRLFAEAGKEADR